MRLQVKKEVRITLELTTKEASDIRLSLHSTMENYHNKNIHLSEPQTEFYRALWSAIDKALEHEDYSEEIHTDQD